MGRTELGILGPLRFVRDDEVIEITGRRRRLLLVRLLLVAGRVVPTDVLAEDVWEGSPPPGAASTLQSHVSLLRRLLGIDRLPVCDGGYRLLVDPDEIDAARFVRLVEEAAEAVDGGKHVEAVTRLVDALGLWRGEALADAGDAAWAQGDRTRLEESRLRATELLLESHLALGHAEHVVALAEAAVAADPFRERLWGHLMVGLYRSGRQADALRSFQRVRAVLADELGLRPSRYLARIEQAILAHDPDLELLAGGHGSASGPSTAASVPDPGPAPAVAGHPPAPDVAQRRTVDRAGLPRQLTDFVGRRSELEAGARCLAHHRLVTITGSGGCGKTRLSLALATAWSQGGDRTAWFVPLDVLEPADAPGADAGPSVAPAPGTAGGVRGDRDRGRDGLVDFERRNTDFRRVASMVATVLGLSDLGAGDGDGAGTGDPRSVLDQRSDRLVQSIAEVVSQTGGATLLVLDNCEHVVAAAAELAEQLLTRCGAVSVLATSREPLGVPGEDLFPLQPLGVPPEARTVRRLDEVLAAESSQLFIARARSVLPGFELDDDGIALLASICRSLDGIPLAIELAAGLVHALSLDDIATQVDRQLRLTTDLRQVPVRQRTLEGAIEWSFRSLDDDERKLITRLSVFRGSFTLEAAVAVSESDGDGDDRHQVAATLSRLVRKSVVSRDGGAPHAVRYRLLMAIRQYAEEHLLTSADHDRARLAHARYYRSIAELADRHAHGPDAGEWLARVEVELPNLRVAFSSSIDDGDLETSARLAGALRWFFGRMASFDEAVEWLDTLMTRREELKPAVRLQVLNSWLAVAFAQGVFTSTADVGEEAIALARELGDDQELATTLTMRGGTAAYEGNVERATACFVEAERLCRRLNDRWGLAWLLTAWGITDRRTGQLAGSQEKHEEALDIFERIGDLHSTILPTLNLGLIAQEAGDLERAARLCESAADVARKIGDRQYLHVATASLGRILLLQGQLGPAREMLANAIRGFAGVENRLSVAIALEGLAIIAGAEGRHAEAVMLWGHTDATRRASKLPMTEARTVEREHHLAEARARLGEHRFAEAWDAGRRMPGRSAATFAAGAAAPAG